MNARRLYILFLVLSLAGYIWIGVNLRSSAVTAGDAAHDAIPGVCLFKEVTGIPCPSCGATRSILLLARGDLRGALLMNPLGILLAAGLLVIPIWIVTDVMRRRVSFYRAYRSAEQLLSQNIGLASVCIALVMANWVWNIAKGL